VRGPPEPSPEPKMIRSPIFALAALAVALFALASPTRADHKDARLGFTVQTPREWTELPQQAKEVWIVGAYRSKKFNVWTEKGGWTQEHYPDMQMIAFVSEDLKNRVDVTKGKDKKGNEKILLEFISPYKNYKDYMQRRYTGGGWFVEKEDKTKVGDVEVTTYEIKVEKLSQDGPKRIITWIYHVPDVDIAIQFECLQDAWPKLQAEFVRCLKSFKTTERSGEALSSLVTTGKKVNLLDMDEMTPEERKNARISLEKETHEQAVKKAADGWTAKRMGRFLVLNHADEKFAKTIVDHAEAVWQWLETTFPFVGDKEYVRAPVLRICKDQNEFMAFAKAAGWFSLNDLEITTYQDYGGSTSYSLANVNRRIFDIWFEDRDRELYWAMPRWLSTGLQELAGNLHTKNGKVVFGKDDWARDETRNAIREGKAKKPRELMTLSGDDFWGDFWNAQQQSQMLVAFFVTGPASRNPRTKNVLTDYLKALKSVQMALKAEEEAKGDEKDKKPTTEEEEDAAFKNQRQGYKDKEKRILEETKKKAFPGWTDKDWEAFEDIYFKAVG
jgi:hypothetical protein